MAEEAVRFLLERLVSLIRDEVGLIGGVNKQMQELSSNLSAIQAVLTDAEDRQLLEDVEGQGQHAIRDWLRKLNDHVYDIEDILDEFTTQLSLFRKKNSILVLLPKILFRRKMGKRIKQMAESLKAVDEERKRFHLEEKQTRNQTEVAAGAGHTNSKRETSSILNEPGNIYGREEEKDKIVDMLINSANDSPHLLIFPIIGLGGLGKTTLAKLVYNDERVKEHFKPQLWVCVSDNFDLRTLVKEMIESATGRRPEDSMNLDDLQQQLHGLLSGKRYLLILDDVWDDDQEKWAKLKDVLACGARGASIIITTRQVKVADIMRTLPAHCLKELSTEDCWLLFKNLAFGQERNDIEKHPHLEDIGRQIVSKCKGVPLAARTLGGLLRFKREEKDWNKVNENETWNLPQGENSILPALRVSYQHLPAQLRQCFVYCAAFPKDYKIEKREIIFCWMAHGCIRSHGEQDVEDLGDDVWNELVLRSLFQDVGSNWKGETTFKVHDLVHDLAISIMENKVPRNNASTSNSKIRQVNWRLHVAFPANIDLLKMDISSIIKKFRRLRMLDVSRAAIKNLPSEIGKLKLLRYLNLSHNSSIRILPNTIGRLWNLQILNLSDCGNLQTLPNTICDLWNLQILDLSDCFRLERLPKNMSCLSNLCHLCLEGCTSLSEMPPKIRELTRLKTLSLFIVSGTESESEIWELQYLNDLGGKLEIRHLERVRNDADAKKANLIEKANLRVLVLRWDWEGESRENRDEKVLEVLEPHPNLKILSIFGFRGITFPLWKRTENISEIYLDECRNCLCLARILGDLPRLKSLWLYKLDALEYLLEDEGGNGTVNKRALLLFPSLESLTLKYLPNLKGLLKLEEEEQISSSFPNLQTLSISECPVLKLSYLIVSSSSLNELNVWGCSRLNMSSFPKQLHNLTSLILDLGIDEEENNKRVCIPNEALHNLSNLKTLTIAHVEEYTLPVEEGLRGLKSLTELVIWHSERMRCLPEGWLRHLTALETLEINSCEELVELGEGIKYLQHSLTTLKLFQLPKMVCLPESLQHLTSLRLLRLYILPELSSLPDWLPNLMSLESLHIFYCMRLESLPSGIKGMPNLHNLSITKCSPELQRRLEKGKGEDWHTIAHIPYVDIY